MESNKYISWNPPSATTVISFAVLLLSIIGVAMNNASERANQEARITSIERDRVAAVARYEAEKAATRLELQRQLDPLYKMYVEYPVIVQRLTTAEANIEAGDLRMSRIADTLGPIRESIGDLSTNIKLLTQRFDQQFPLKRMEDYRVDSMTFFPLREIKGKFTPIFRH